jgi:hypothetical protein
MSSTEAPIIATNKTLQRMMYLYAAVMQGWQIRLLPLADTNGKEQFEFMKNHLQADPPRTFIPQKTETAERSSDGK